jgi:hypothetical protein
MSGTYLTLTNNTLARLNEVQLTSTTFTSARGIQVQAKNAVNESIRYINQKEFSYPFNHATETKTLTAGTVRYSLPTSTKHVDYNTFRLIKDEDLGNSGGKLGILQYNDYINNYITQEDEIVTTTLDGSLTDSATTITVASTTGFDSAGTLHIQALHLQLLQVLHEEQVVQQLQPILTQHKLHNLKKEEFLDMWLDLQTTVIFYTLFLLSLIL